VIHDLAVCDQIVQNLASDITLQLALLILIITMQIGLVAGIIIYAYIHRGN